jgi:hypothetical protein
VIDLTERLRQYIRDTCAVGPDAPERVAEAIGVRLVPGYRGYAEIEPGEPGIAMALLSLDDEGGPVRFLQISLTDEARVALRDLADGLGEPAPYAIEHQGDAERLVYDVPIDGRRRACRVAIDLRPDRGETDRLVSGFEVLP